MRQGHLCSGPHLYQDRMSVQSVVDISRQDKVSAQHFQCLLCSTQNLWTDRKIVLGLVDIFLLHKVFEWKNRFEERDILQKK